MQVKLSAIVLRTTPYSDSSVIVRLFTDDYGMQSYLVNGVRKKKAAITSAMLQPLTLVQLEAYQRENAGLQRIKELHVDPVLPRLQQEPLHGLAASMLAECLMRAIREDSEQPELFAWLQQQILLLETSDQPGAEMLAFLTRLTEWLGFGPQADQYREGAWFNLNEGRFDVQHDMRSSYAGQNTARQLGALLLRGAFVPGDAPGSAYLDDLLKYYQLHLPGFGLPRSLDVVRSMLLI